MPARSLYPRFQADPGALVSLDSLKQQDKMIGPTPSPDGPRGLCRCLRRARGHVENILLREEFISVGEVSGGRGGQRRRWRGGGGQSCLAGDLARLELRGSTHNPS